MKLTIESTAQTTDFKGLTCRIWKGVAPSGAECIVFVPAIGCMPGAEAAILAEESLAKELREISPPPPPRDFLARLLPSAN